jgi:putative SOS response-associated peptidase YedK
MCGRFTQKYTWRELVELYRLTQPARNLEPRYNVAPCGAQNGRPGAARTALDERRNP